MNGDLRELYARATKARQTGADAAPFFSQMRDVLAAAVTRDPRDAASWENLGHVLNELRDADKALAAWAQALTLQPRNAALQYRRAVLLAERGRNDEALAGYDAALAADPGHAAALNNRGFLRWTARHDAAGALADLERAFALDATIPYLAGAILHLKMYVADWRDFDARKKALEDGVRAGGRVARPFMFQAVCDDPALLQACSRIHVRDLFPPVAAPPVPPRDSGPGRIRLGYVSGEFRDQATAILMAGLYEHHDRAKFEVIAIDAGGGDGSAMRARLERAFDRWIDIAHLDDARAADAIRAAGIDILIDLNGFFGRHRMGVFARRPAPVQVNYLGFPATLGAPYIGWLIADGIVIPPHEHHFYDERVIALPGCYQVNDDRGRPMAPVPSRAEAGLPPDAFVFCNFNQSYKLTPATFDGWMRILMQVDNSVLWLLQGPAPFAENLRREAEARGVDGARLLFAPDRPPPLHLARLALADLFLDGLPYNAHTTGSDALWAGVPLVTLRGTAFPGRVGASLLTAAGLDELIAHTPADYEALAVALARDPARLAALRARLQRRDSALFDTDGFRRRIEAAYETIWRKSQSP